MVKKYYQILGVSESATSEQIKQAYRKLAIKWHPDKFSVKSLSEKEEANKKMREINGAFEVLGDEDKRKRYDLGETNFTSDFAGSACEAEMEDIKERIRRKQEEIDLTRDLLENEEERIRIMEEMWLLNAEFIDRDGTYIEISAAMGFNFPRVYASDLEAEGYSHLWNPYKDWLDKVWKMPITLKRGEKEESDELKKFKAEMFKAIKEVGVILETRKKDKEKSRKNSSLERDRVNAIEAIERELRERGIKAEDLGENSNYQEQINNLDKQWKIRSLRDKIKEYICHTSKEKESYGKQDNLRHLKEKLYQNEEEWNKEKETLLTEVEELKKTPSKNNQEKLTKKVNDLEELAKQLLKEIQVLKVEIQEVKEEGDNSPSALSFINQKEQELQLKQSRLQQLNSIITNNNNNNNNNNNPWPIIPIVGTVGVVALLGLIAYRLSKKRVRR